MQAMIYQRYGDPDVLQLTSVTKPTPGPHDVLIRVHAAALNAADAYMLHGKPAMLRLSAGLRAPKRPILGSDVAGQVVAIGTDVTQFRVGDAVYGDLSGSGRGGFAEFVCAPENVLALKPASVTFEQAAAVPMAGVTALQGLRNAGQVRAGQHVLIHGASGGVGTFALQLARVLGATVTAVCSARNVELAHQLGAHHVIDYTQEDFADHGPRYDLVLVANGTRTIADYRRAVRPGGRCVIAGGAIKQIMAATLLGPVLSLLHGITICSLVAKPDQQDLAFLSGLLDADSIVPVVDRCFPLSELPAALRYRATGHPRGKVVISI